MSGSVEQILRNIYGTTATGEIKDLNMKGGDSKNVESISVFNVSDNELPNVNRPIGKVKYIDENVSQSSLAMQGGTKRKNIRKDSIKMKAGTKNTKLDTTIYKSISAFINTNQCKEATIFEQEFYLNYRFQDPFPHAIVIIPDDKELNEMMTRINTKEKKGTKEYIKYLRENADVIGYNKYLFYRFIASDGDRYKIDPKKNDENAYPNAGFGTIRRGALNGYVYTLTADDISGKAIIDNELGEQSTVQYVARCENGVYIFKGTVPEKAKQKLPNEKSSSNSLKIENTFGYFTGGSKNSNENSSLKCLSKYNEIYNGDREQAAEHFLRCYDNKKRIDRLPNGNSVYSAIYLALNDPNLLSVNDIGNESNRNLAENLEFGILPTSFNNSVKNIQNKIKKLYKTCENSNKLDKFISYYHNLYKGNDKNKIYADILTGYLQNNEYDNDIVSAYNLIKTNKGISTANMIKNSFLSSPLPSAYGVQEYPYTLKSFEDTMKNNRSIEDTNIPEQIFESKNDAIEKEKLENPIAKEENKEIEIEQNNEEKEIYEQKLKDIQNVEDDDKYIDISNFY